MRGDECLMTTQHPPKAAYGKSYSFPVPRDGGLIEILSSCNKLSLEKRLYKALKVHVLKLSFKSAIGLFLPEHFMFKEAHRKGIKCFSC